MRCVVFLAMVICISGVVSEGAVASKKSNPAAERQTSGSKPCAEIFSKAKFVHFKKYTNVYISEDHPIQYYSIPDEFEGHHIALRAIQSENPVRFKVKRAGFVRIVAAGRPINRLLSEGWVEIDRVTLATQDGQILPDPIYILEKYLDEGEYVIPCEGTFGIRLLKE